MARIIGIILVIVGAVMCVVGLGDSIYNGLDFSGILLFLGGAYLMLAPKESLRSWNLFRFLKEEDEDEEYFE